MRKEVEKIAENFRKSKPTEENLTKFHQWQIDLLGVAEALNLPVIDHEHFLRASDFKGV